MARNYRLRKRSLFAQSKPVKAPRKRLVRHILWGAFKRMLMAFGALFLISLISMSFLLSSLVEHKAPPVYPNEFALSFTLEGDMPEYHTVQRPFATASATFRDVIDILDSSRRDPRVKALVVKLEGNMSNIAQIQELRAAVERFQLSGRKAYIYAPSYGGLGQGMGSYYLASVFDEIWMQPIGSVSIPGIRMEIPYLKEGLDKIGVQPQFFARKEYKSVFESFTSDQMSPATREAMSSIVDELGSQLLAGMAEGRAMTPEQMQQMIDIGLITDEEALKNGLVTNLGSFDGLKEAISVALTGQEDKKVFLDMMSYKPPRPSASGAETGSGGVALIYVTGNIMANQEVVHAPAFFGRDILTSDQVEEAVRKAADDPRIKVMVVRIDSPGGSPVAAEMIRMALKEAKAAGKMIVVSMGSTAASGGYWVAAPADYIFAAPSTLTGSIGVAGGKIVFQETWEKLGVNWDAVSFGENAGMMSFNRPFTAEGTERMNHLMDTTYQAFIERVADGRNMDLELVDKIARGRVWTGSQAKDVGLVDEIGGLSDALEYAALSLGYESRFQMPLQILPEPKSAFDMLKETLQLQAGLGAGASGIKGYLNGLGLLGRSLSTPHSWAYEPLAVR